MSLLFPTFRKNYKVIAFDNRGAGRTDKPDSPYSIDMMADDTKELMRTLGINQANILGISMGGRIVLSPTLNHPELVRSFVLVSAVSAVPNNNNKNRRIVWFFIEIVRRLAKMSKKYSQPQYAYLRQLEASRNYDATSRLNEIRVPTLIVHGNSDRTSPYELAKDMNQRITASKIVTMRGGHLSFPFRRK